MIQLSPELKSQATSEVASSSLEKRLSTSFGCKAKYNVTSRFSLGSRMPQRYYRELPQPPHIW